MFAGERYNTAFLVIGLAGTVLCFIVWYRKRSVPPLIGIGLFGYFLVSSLVVWWRGQ